MTNSLRLGFIGGGINSAVGTTHFVASQMDGYFKVQAGCFSRQPDVNIKTADQWGIAPERRYDDIPKFLAHEKDQLDAVVILTPTPNHVEHVIQVLQQKIPIICEKALASSSADALLIQQAQNECQGFLAVTYNYTGYPMLRELRQLIRQGSLGKVVQIQIEMPQEGFARLNSQGMPMLPQQWRLQDADLPTISLDLGVHLHNIIDFLTGEKPQELIALESSKGNFQQVVDNTMCIARYTHSLECGIWFSKAALGHRNGLRVRVFGEQASVEWFQMDPEFLIYHDRKGHKSIIDRASVDMEIAHDPRYNRFKSGHPAGFIEAFANLYWDIAENLREYSARGKQTKSDYVFTVQDALEGLLMLEAMTQSSKERCWKTLPPQGKL